MTHYQALLLDSDRIQFGSALNPATLLPLPEGPETHNCHQILAATQGTRPDLTDQPFKDADYTWYTDGSIYLQDGIRRAGAAVTTEDQIVWASALPAGTSAQRAELIALTKALQLAEGKKLNVFTDSRYAFATAHIHGEIYRNRGLLTSEGKAIKNKEQILALLDAVFLPSKLSIMYCPGHQKGTAPENRGNRFADEATRKAAQGSQLLAMEVLPEEMEEPPKSPRWKYKQSDLDQIHKLKATHNKDQGIWTKDGKEIVPERDTFFLIDYLHKLTHLGTKKMKTLLEREETGLYLLGRERALKTIADQCKACAQVNVARTKDLLGIRMRGHRPGTHWEIDFTR